MSYTVVGLFNNRNQAQTAIRELTQRGFIPENIDIVNNKGSNSNAHSEEVIITESVGNFLQSLFSSEKRNDNAYANVAANTDCIVTIHVDDHERAREVAFVLDKNGAIDIDSETSIQGSENIAQTNHNANTSSNNTHLQNTTNIPVIEERLQIDKQVVETGGMRVKSRIIEKPIEENVRLRNQFVIVNRRSVDREVTDDDLSNFREGEIEFLELAEVPVIAKKSRVVEEVEIGRQVSEHEETVQETLRRTNVQVEEINRNVTDSDLNTRKVNRSSNS